MKRAAAYLSPEADIEAVCGVQLLVSRKDFYEVGAWEGCEHTYADPQGICQGLRKHCYH